MARIWMPLPSSDFDPTESAVPWHLLTEAGHEVVFATSDGAPARCDPLLLTGVVFGQLGARPEPKALYARMEASPAFRAPVPWADLEPDAFDALWLCGGHAKGMRPYLEDPVLRARVRTFWALERPVAAICHGVIVLARAGVLEGRRSTALPRYMERTAWLLTSWKLGDYYRTYPTWVQDEVEAAGARFERGPVHLVAQGTREDDDAAFVVEDGRYMSGRWPGDAWALGRRLLAALPTAA